jgi:hypothetical protein
MVFLASTNVLGYLVTNKRNAVIFFALVSLLTYQFSKNMAVVLLVAIIATNFLMSNKLMREGLENQTATDAVEKAGEINPDIKKASDALNATNDVSKAKEIVKNNSSNVSKEEPGKPVDPNNPELNNVTDNSSENVPEGFGEKFGPKKGKTEEHFGPRLDYAATLEQSYQNLDSLLGSESIQRLTSDTQKLMQQQQTLFNTMNQMVPVLEGAQNMLKGFNINDLSSSLKQVASLGDIQMPAMPNMPTK